jgi:hypothetical protein
LAKIKSSPLKGKDAEIIAKKLSQPSDIDRSGKHQRAAIRHNGEVIGQFGWRHDKKAANGHIPSNLRISQHDTLEMVRCNIDYDGYIELLRKKNLISDASK